MFYLTPSIQSQDVADQLIKDAKKYLGVKHKMGGTTAKGFDCSGFIQSVYRKNNIALPRTAQQQSTQGYSIKLRDSQKGDLLFFRHSSKINHVGMVISNKKGTIQMIHVSSSKGVIITHLNENNYWWNKFTKAKSIIYGTPAIKQKKKKRSKQKKRRK